MEIKFSINEATALAAFLAQIVREGLDYKVRETGDGWAVLLTGGY